MSELPRVEWADASIPALIQHIESTHHAFTRAELPRIGRLLDDVARLHGERHPHMLEVARRFRSFTEEMLVHMRREENALFPALRELKGNERRSEVSTPIRVMTCDHFEAGAVLKRLRELTGDYDPPNDACDTFRAALDGLAKLDANVHEHVYLENDVLFRRALEKLRVSILG